MKPFRFTLESLRVLRRGQEREAMEKYAHALLENATLKKKLDALGDELRHAQFICQQSLLTGGAMGRILQQQLCCTYLQDQRKIAAAALAESGRKVDFALQQMLLARQRNQILEKVQNRQREAYQREVSRAEQKQLDELAGQRFKPVLSWKGQLDE